MDIIICNVETQGSHVFASIRGVVLYLGS